MARPPRPPPAEHLVCPLGNTMSSSYPHTRPARASSTCPRCEPTPTASSPALPLLSSWSSSARAWPRPFKPGGQTFRAWGTPACYSSWLASAWEHGHSADNHQTAQGTEEAQKVVSTPVAVPCPAAEASVVLDPLPTPVTKAPRRTEDHLHTPTPRRRRQVGRNPVRTSQTDRISSALPLNPRLIKPSRSRLHRLSPSLRRNPNLHPHPHLNLNPSPSPSRSPAQLSHRQRHPRMRGKRHEKRSAARQKSGRPKRPRRSAGRMPQPG